MAILPVSIAGDGWDRYPTERDFYESQNNSRIPPTVSLGEETDLNNKSDADETVDYAELISDSAFLGDYPFNVILEGLENQFNDYIKLEDKENYVNVFYEQLHASYEEARKDEEHPEELKTALDNILAKFVDYMNQMFNKRLMINIYCLESEDIDDNEVEFILRRLYEFFILGAKNNFKVVIGTDINTKINTLISNDSEYFAKVNELLSSYSPIIREIGPMEFIKYRGDMEIYDLFDSGKVNGNFLKKYSPKLYQNEEFQVELVNYITMMELEKEESKNG